MLHPPRHSFLPFNPLAAAAVAAAAAPPLALLPSFHLIVSKGQQRSFLFFGQEILDGVKGQARREEGGMSLP